MKRVKKLHYIGYNKETKEIVVATNKEAISTLLEISVDTIGRHLKTSPIYETPIFIIWRDITIQTIRRGFAIKSSSRYRR